MVIARVEWAQEPIHRYTQEFTGNRKGAIMKAYSEMSKEELLQEKESLLRAYEDYQKMDLSLNMARGKPAPDQFDLAMDLLNGPTPEDVHAISALEDIRNYGGMDGIEGAKEVLATMAEVKPEEVIVFGNSALNIIFDQITRGMITGYLGETPWCKLPKVKWLCPVPGYDRHFAITEHYGIEMINIPMNADGPDMDLVEEYVKDPAVKGIFCVPKYANPDGCVYSDETVRRFANLKPAAKDFRIFWDNAYAVHHLYDDDAHRGHILNILEECRKAGNENLVFEFVSTSKVSFSGGGIAGMMASEENLADVKKTMTVQTIGHDKINQFRHAKFFDNGRKIDEHMKKHAALLRPKFELVQKKLSEGLDGLAVGEWTNPLGGYFVTFKTIPGCASRVIGLAKDAGVVMTGAGAPFPYHKDPEDAYIRIAPTFPSVEELGTALDIFVVCVKLASVEAFLK